MKNNKKKFLLQSHSLIKITGTEDRDILYTKSSICFLLQLLSDGNIDAIKAINTILLDAVTSSLSGTQSKLIAEYIHKEMMNSDSDKNYIPIEFSDIDKELMEQIINTEMKKDYDVQLEEYNINTPADNMNNNSDSSLWTKEDILDEAGDMEV
jgi:hypothetical protein